MRYDLDRRKVFLMKAATIEAQNHRKDKMLGTFKHNDKRQYCQDGVKTTQASPEEIEKLLAESSKQWGKALRPVM